MSAEAKSLDWLQQLERRIKQAAEEIRRLRAENRDLQAQVKKLTAEERPSEDATRWAAERDEIRKRVDRLVAHLEELAAEASEAP